MQETRSDPGVARPPAELTETEVDDGKRESEHDQALSWLDQAYQERFNRVAYLRREAIWNPLRQDPRFQELLHRINLPE